MKEMFDLEHKGNERVDSIREFCELKGLKYVGSFARKADGEIVGDIVQIAGMYYLAEMSSWRKDGDKWASTARFQLYSDFNQEEYLLLEECNVRIDVWDIRVDDEGPMHRYAFPDVESARKVVSHDLDFDVWIDGKEVSREEFLKQ